MKCLLLLISHAKMYLQLTSIGRYCKQLSFLLTLKYEELITIHYTPQENLKIIKYKVHNKIIKQNWSQKKQNEITPFLPATQEFSKFKCIL